MGKTYIQSKLETIPESIDSLEFLQERGFEECYIDFRNIESTLYKLQATILTLIDIGRYIIATLGLNKPGFNADIIKILVEAGFINAQDEERHTNTLLLRNQPDRLNKTHDMDIFYEMIQEEIHDIRMLYQTFYDIIETHIDSDLSVNTHHSL